MTATGTLPRIAVFGEGARLAGALARSPRRREGELCSSSGDDWAPTQST